MVNRQWKQKTATESIFSDVSGLLIKKGDSYYHNEYLDIRCLEKELPIVRRIIRAVVDYIAKRGTPTRVDTTSSTEIVGAPGKGFKLELCGFFLSVDADEIVRLRWGGASGDIIAMIPTKGIGGLVTYFFKEYGGENENLFLEKTGTGNVQGTVWTETVEA